MSDQPLTDQPYSTSLAKLEELQDWVGKELGLSSWTTVTQAQINAFAKATGDEQWIHIDVEKSKLHSPYKTTVAHGFMLLSQASKIGYETLHITDVVMGVNYGLDRVRFPSATPCGAQFRGRVSLLAFETIPGGARYKLGITYELRGQEKPACVAEFIGQVYTA